MQTEQRGFSLGPVLALFFTAPLIAEFLLGDLPMKMLPALILLAPLYGGGALLIRELVRRSGRSWPSILLLGMAYAIVEEAFADQSLFDPNYLKLNLHLLDPAYIPALGISAWWTLFMLITHAVWSISTPIALIEGCVPERARRAWMGRIGLAVTTVLYVFGLAGAAAVNYKTDHYMASKAQFAWSAVAVVLLVVLAFLVPAKRTDSRQSMAPSALALGLVALVFASAALIVPKDWGWGAVAVLLALVAGMLLIVYWWGRNGVWTMRHQIAMGAGAALAYGWHAFLMHPVVTGVSNVSFRVGNAVFLAGAIALIAFAFRRAGRRSAVAA